MRRKILRMALEACCASDASPKQPRLHWSEGVLKGPRLTLMDAEDTLSPPDIIQRERDDLAGAQAIGGDQDKYRVVAQTNSGSDVDRSQKLDHVGHGKARAAAQAIESRRVDLLVESRLDSSVCCEKSQQSAQAAISCWRLPRHRRFPAWLTYPSTCLGWREPIESAEFPGDRESCAKRVDGA